MQSFKDNKKTSRRERSPEKARAEYAAPRILSREPLEAVAAACPPSTGGKDRNLGTCTVLSS